MIKKNITFPGRGGAACFSAGRGDHPWIAGGFEDGRCKEQQAIVQVTKCVQEEVRMVAAGARRSWLPRSVQVTSITFRSPGY